MNRLEATWSFWGLHQRLCDGQTIYKEHEKIVKVLNDGPVGASELSQLLNYHYSLDIFKKKLL